MKRNQEEYQRLAHLAHDSGVSDEANHMQLLAFAPRLWNLALEVVVLKREALEAVETREPIKLRKRTREASPCQVQVRQL